MRWCALGIAGAVFPSAFAYARAPTTAPASAHPAAPVSRPSLRPAAPLQMLPSVGRVRVEAARDHVTVLEDVHLPRGEWQAGDVDLYVAFGSPGTPIAVDARLVAATPGGADLRPDDAGEALAVEPAVRQSVGAQLLLGPAHMAGVVVRVKDTELRRAYAAADLVGVRLRSLLGAPASDSRGERTVIVRLGVAAGLPITLNRVQVVSLEPGPWIQGAEATLCGPDAEARPLVLSILPKPSTPPPPDESSTPPIAPSMAVRHATDDLCIRWWARDG